MSEVRSQSRNISPALVGAIFVGLLVGVFRQRAELINGVYGAGISCSGCLTAPLLLHDLGYFGGLLLLVAASLLASHRWIAAPLRLASLVGVFIYWADVQVMRAFSTRLDVADVRIYGEQIALLWRHAAQTGLLSARSVFIAAIGLGVGGVLLILPPVHPRFRRRTASVALLPPGLLLLLGLTISPPPFVHDWALVNVARANVAQGATTPYTNAFISRFQAPPVPPRICSQGRALRPNIILLILESWSPYQSLHFSGIHDWTPKLDELATRHTSYARVHSGGYTTAMGLLSILSGVEYVAPVSGERSFAAAMHQKETLASRLTEMGYITSFLTSGNLGFSSKGEWLRHIGFSHVEGHDHPAYEGRPRRHFDAVADELLYARSLTHVRDELKGNAPYFLVVENVSTHHPYVHPRTGETSAEAVFRYMDETVMAFHDALQAQGFFDDGLLFLIGDHRAMVPVSEQEMSRFGPAAVSLIPAIVKGAGLSDRGRIEVPFHQSDLLPSLVRLAGQEVCRTGPLRDFFDPENTEPRCLFHARGDDRSRIDVFCPEGRAVIGLRGDATKVLEREGISRQRGAALVEQVNAHRILGQDRGLHGTAPALAGDR